MNHNWFSNLHYVYTIIPVVHAEFTEVVLTEYQAFKSLSKTIKEQAAAAVISEKNKSRKMREKRKPWLKRETVLAELRLEDEHSYNILLRMTSENFEEIFQLIKDDITKENTKMTELIPPRL